MSRSTGTLDRTSALFDFDVVTDVPPRPARKPDAAPKAARPDPGPAVDPAKTAEA